MTADLWGLIGKSAWLDSKLTHDARPHEVVGWKFDIDGLQLALIAPDGIFRWRDIKCIDCFADDGVKRPSPSKLHAHIRGLDGP